MAAAVLGEVTALLLLPLLPEEVGVTALPLGELVALLGLAVAEAVAALRAAVRVIKEDFRVVTRGGNEGLLAPVGTPAGRGGLLLMLLLMPWALEAAPARLPLEVLALADPVELRRPNRKSIGEFDAVSTAAAALRSTFDVALGSAKHKNYIFFTY